MTGTEGVLDKVTAFITRETPSGMEVLLFRHPGAGVQIPAGTVEEGESPEQAVLREAAEETGLRGLRIRRHLGSEEQQQRPGHALVLHATPVYARPDPTSFAWARFRRGLTVQVERRAGNFIQVTYREWDDFERPSYVTYQITGWAPAESLCTRSRRHFYHLACGGDTPGEWDASTDNHTFHLFWAPVDTLPPIVKPQDEWLVHAPWKKG